MSKIDSTYGNKKKYEFSRYLLIGLFVATISALGITGISKISAQETATSTNATTTMSEKGNITGSIDVERTIADAFKSKITINIIDAITKAQSSVGPNSFVKEAELTHVYGYLVYKIKVVDENMKKYKVLVDPGNGNILLQKEITYPDYDHDKLGKDYGYKYQDEKYGYDKMKYDKMK